MIIAWFLRFRNQSGVSAAHSLVWRKSLCYDKEKTRGQKRRPMMQYDFETCVDRRGKDSIAANVVPFPGVELAKDVKRYPMWVADMSFPTAPFIIDAIQKRLMTPSFGYFETPDAYYDAILYWHRIRNSRQDITREMIGYENGVLGGVGAAVRAFSAAGDSILVHSPAYVGFIGTLRKLGRNMVTSPLQRDAAGVWRMDYADMEKKILENKIHLAILCSPHNPTGRVWEKEELETALEICRRHDVIVISDEIWSDIIMPGYRHIPTQSVSPDAKARTIALYAPSKTFSLAGLIGAYSVICDSYLRDRVLKASENAIYNAMNVLSMHALIGAYSDAGMAWTDQMCAVIDRNIGAVCDFVKERCPGVRLMRSQGTYMLYLDCAEWCRAHSTPILDLLLRGVRAGVIWQNGEGFLWPDTIRVNTALPHPMVMEALEILKKKVFI